MYQQAQPIKEHTTTPEERLARLKELEGIIRRGKEVFLEVGRALEEIRLRRLYYPEHETFAAYCEATFPGWPMRRVYRYTAWSRIDDVLRPNGHKLETEAQARQMHRLVDDPETAERVWREVGKATGGKRPSEALREAIDRELGVEKKGTDVHFLKESDEWYTPADFVELVERALGGEEGDDTPIDLDPCAEDGKRVPAKAHFTEDDDGLSREWHGRVYMNPPYSQADRWVKKLLQEYAEGRTTAAVVLVAARTDTEWYALLREFPRCEVKGRIKFNDATGSPRHSAPFPSVAFYLGPDTEAFVRAFKERGQVLTPWRRSVPIPEDAPEDFTDEMAKEMIAIAAEEVGGEHGEFFGTDMARRTLRNRTTRLHNEALEKARVDALPYIEETGLDDIEILHGEFQEVLAPRIADKSVDLFLTDPPYAKGPETLKLWDDLGAFAARALKPDGFLVSYMGTDHTEVEKDKIRKSIPWWWTVIITHQESDPSFERRYQRNYKPVGVFGRVKDRLLKRPVMRSLRKGKGSDKTYHDWGQPVEEAERFIQELTEPGELVVDPFLGGGTTAVAALKTGRKCMAAEKDERYYRVSVDRVIRESNTRYYGGGLDSLWHKGEQESPAREPREQRVRRVLDSLGPNVVLIRPADLPKASWQRVSNFQFGVGIIQKLKRT